MNSETNDRDKGTKFWFGFFLGGLIGAGLLFFLGTKEGRQAKKKLEQRGKDLIRELEEKIKEFEDVGKNIIKEGEDIKKEVAKQIENKRENLSKEAGERISQALERVEQIQTSSAKKTSDLRKRFFKNLPKKK